MSDDDLPGPAPVPLPVTVRMINLHGPDPEEVPEWPTGWPLPRVGDRVLLGWGERAWTVQDVYWYPLGSGPVNEIDPAPPHAHIVLVDR